MGQSAQQHLQARLCHVPRPGSVQVRELQLPAVTAEQFETERLLWLPCEQSQESSDDRHESAAGVTSGKHNSGHHNNVAECAMDHGAERVLPASTANPDIDAQQSPQRRREVEYPWRGGGD